MQKPSDLRRRGPSAGRLLLLATALLGAGCGRPQGPLFAPVEPPLVWPDPPDVPRIRYVGHLGTEEDLKPAVSGMSQFKQAVFGRKNVGVLVCPYAVAVDPGERMFVADSAGGVVHLLDLKTREYAQFSALAEGARLERPVAMCLVDDQVFVADSSLGRICVFDRTGRFRFSFGEERLERPSGIAYDRERQWVYVSDAPRHLVDVFDKTGHRISSLGGRGLEAGRFNYPTQLWVDSAGRLYVCDTLNYRVQVFSREGAVVLHFGTQGDRPGCFAHPGGIATDRFGNIYVTDRQFENVQIFDREGRVLMAFGEEGSKPGCFWLPAGVWVDENGRIFVADSFNKRVQVFELLEAEKP